MNETNDGISSAEENEPGKDEMKIEEHDQSDRSEERDH